MWLRIDVVTGFIVLVRCVVYVVVVPSFYFV